MLAGLLKSNIAVRVSIKIVNAFIEMRKILTTNGQIFERLTNIEYKLFEHDKKFDEVFNQFQDEKEMYHPGASIKDLGKKCFGINKIEDMEIIKKFIDNKI